MIQTATRYTNVRQAARVRTPRRSRHPQGLFVPTLAASAQCLREWFWRELKDGGALHTYLQREKASVPHLMRLAGRIMHGFQQNPKSDFVRKAAIPAKLYHRWKNEDEHFFEDDSNLRSLKRDNPDLPVYVPPAPLPRARFHKVYPAEAEQQLRPTNPTA